MINYHKNKLCRITFQPSLVNICWKGNEPTLIILGKLVHTEKILD